MNEDPAFTKDPPSVELEAEAAGVMDVEIRQLAAEEVNVCVRGIPLMAETDRMYVGNNRYITGFLKG